MGNTNNKTKLDIKTLQKGGEHDKWQVVGFYQILMTEISKYLTITDEDIKIQYYRNPKSKNIFNIFSPSWDIIRHMMGNSHNGWWWLHFNHIDRGWEIFYEIILVKMGVWNPLERPLMKKAVEYGLLTWDMLYLILDNPNKATKIINKRIQEKRNAPSVAAQNVRDSRKQLESQLQGEANRLNNILYEKEREKNNAGKILTNTRDNYQQAINEYNKKLNELNKLKK